MKIAYNSVYDQIETFSFTFSQQAVIVSSGRCAMPYIVPLCRTDQLAVQRAGCGPLKFWRPRGCRAGLHVQRRRARCQLMLSGVTPVVSTREVMQISVINGLRMPTFSIVAQPVRPPVRVTVQTVEQFAPCFFMANLRGGFVHKSDELEAVLHENDVDIACTTERLG